MNQCDGTMIFVTGATGFIGQKLVMRLKEKGARLKVLSRFDHPDYETVVCDLETDLIPEDALEGIDTVFHLAGFAHDLHDASEIEHFYRAVNVAATVRLVELAVTSNVKSFVFVSSVKAGGCDEVDVDIQPEGVYGQTKREAELKFLEIGRQSGMLVSIVRPSLVYGAGVKGNLAMMRRGVEQGWFPPLPETGNSRSMIHVDDLVQALLLVAEDSRANNEIFIATDGKPHSSREIYESICHAVGKTIPNWSIPEFLFDALAKLSPKLRYKVDKLLGNEEYSSEKLESLGFRAERTLKDWNHC
jgi:nucleoside-diphosphate-sugar epimerase